MSAQKVKGTLLKIDISSVMTAVSQLTALQSPSIENTAFESTDIDQTDKGEKHDPTGYTKSDGFMAEGFFDEALAGHLAIRTKIAAAEKIDWQITYSNVGASVQEFTTAAAKWELMTALKEGMKFKVSSTAIDGQPTWTT